jgi:hypothetical protein
MSASRWPRHSPPTPTRPKTSPTSSHQKGHQLSALRANSLRIRTGNFLRPCRELNRAIREIFSLIRESALVHFFGICFDDKCDRPDRPRLCREGEEGAARCSKPLKPISRSNPALVHVKGALGNSGNLTPSSSTRTNGVSAFEDCGTLTAASASTGAINLPGRKVRWVRAVCLPASEGVRPRVRIRLAPAGSPLRT